MAERENESPPLKFEDNNYIILLGKTRDVISSTDDMGRVFIHLFSCSVRERN